MLGTPARTPPPSRTATAPRTEYTTPLRRKALMGDTDAARHLVAALKHFQERMVNHNAVHLAYTEWHRIVGAAGGGSKPPASHKEVWFVEQMGHLESKYGLLFDAGAGNAEGCAAVQHAVEVLRSERPLPAHLDDRVPSQSEEPAPLVEKAAWDLQRQARVAALRAAQEREAQAEAAVCLGVATFGSGTPGPLVRRPTARWKRPTPPAEPSVDEAASSILRNAGPAALRSIGGELAPKRARSI